MRTEPLTEQTADRECGGEFAPRKDWVFDAADELARGIPRLTPGRIVQARMKETILPTGIKNFLKPEEIHRLSAKFSGSP